VIAKPTANKPPAEEKSRRIKSDETNDRPKARSRRDDDDYDDDDRPRKKKKKQEQKGSSAVLWIVGGVAALVLIGGGVVGAMLAFGGKDTTTQVAHTDPPTQPSVRPPVGVPTVTPSQPGIPGQPTNPSPTNTNTTPKQPEPTPPDSGSTPVSTGAGASVEEIHKYVLKSIVWILSITPQGVFGGTGSVVDANERLILTNFHVVANQVELVVFFPIYENGKPIAERDRYMNMVKERTKKPGDLLQAEVIATDTQRDMALIRVPKLPPGTEALPLAKSLPSVGETVHSIGNPGASGALWVYTQGVMRSVYKKKWRTGDENLVLTLDAEVLETQSPTNHGDSGGPLVNGRGELVGVTQGGSGAGNLVSWFISLNEARDFIQREFPRKFGKAWSPLVRAPLRARSGAGAIDVTKLINGLDSRDAKERASAAKNLGELGPDARLAIRRLVKALKDTDELTARAAAESLAKIGAPSRDDLPQLLEALKDPKIEVRRYAATAIGQIGPEAGSAAKDLVEALSDDDDRVRESVVRSLGSLGSGAKATAAPALTKALADKDKDVRVGAATALTNLLSPPTADDAPLLVTVLKQKDPESAVFGARALAALGKQAKAAIPDLIEATKSTDLNVRKEAIVALTAVGPDRKDKDLVPVYLAALKDSTSNTAVRQSALHGIAMLGKELDREKDKEAIAAVIDAIKDSDKEVQKSALSAVSKMGPVVNNVTTAKQIMPTVMDYLQDSDAKMRDQALETIGGLGPLAKDAVPTLITMMEKQDIKLYIDQTKQIHLKPEDEAFVDKISKTIGKIGYGAVGPLLRGLDTSNVNAGLLIGSCRALGEIGPEAKKNQKTIPLLQAISDSKLPRPICVEADRALRKIRK
jgi:HEAT repeat protein